MIPRSTQERMVRESKLGKQNGRTQEIQRLIGRSMRSIVDLHSMKNYQVLIDCDVLQADGGTRTASITGAFIALKICIQKLISQKKIKHDPIIENLAAISCGVIQNQTYLDLDYSEDQGAEVEQEGGTKENDIHIEEVEQCKGSCGRGPCARWDESPAARSAEDEADDDTRPPLTDHSTSEEDLDDFANGSSR